MSHLIEIKINDQLLVFACDTTTTVSEIAREALQEYERAYRYDTPKTVQHVRDSKGRILSGGLQLIGLNLEKSIELVLDEDGDENTTTLPRLIDPKNVLVMYGKWQEYAARQMNGYCQSLGQGDNPCKEAIQILTDLKNSKVSSVQNIVLQSYRTILEKCRNELIQKMTIDGTIDILVNTNSSELVLLCISLLFQLKSSPVTAHLIDIPQLLKDIYSIIKRFPQNETEILNLCEQYGNSVSLLNTSPSQSPSKSDRSGNNIISGSDSNHEQLKRPNSSEANGMSFDRILELLSSSDIRCKIFALEKLERRTEPQATDPRAESGLKPHNSSQTFLTQIVSQQKPNDAYQLLRVLFDCLKSALKQPSQPLSQLSSSHSYHLPLTCLIIENSLSSQETSLPIVQLSLQSISVLVHFIEQRGDQWAITSSTSASQLMNTLEYILNERWKILLTLSHSHDKKYLLISNLSADLLLQFTRHCGWEKYRIKIEYDSILYFLQVNDQNPLVRTYLGLNYLVHCLEMSQKDSNPRENITLGTNQRRRNTNSTEKGNQSNASLINSLFCDENYAIIRSLWKWIIGGYGNELTMKSLESFSAASVLIPVKTFLLKFDIIDKLLHLLTQLVGNEIEILKEAIQGGSLQDQNQILSTINKRSIGYVLKTLVNLTGADGSGGSLSQILIGNIQLEQNIRILSLTDDFIAFYANMLGVET